MSKRSRETLKVLLLQIRDDKRVRREEHESFARHGQLGTNQIDIHNVFDQPKFNQDILEGYDALFIGGASEASVLEPEVYGFVPSCIELIKFCVKAKVPTFASCFGFQLAVLAFGGKITRDCDNFEMGTYAISLNEEAKADLVYKDIPNGFQAASVHQEKTMQVPDSCQLLAYTSDCCHSFKHLESPFWAFQFHPELDRPCLKERLRIYQEKYLDSSDHFKSVIDSLKETPKSNRLVLNFVNRALLA